MSELKFKQTKSDNFSEKEISEGDLIAYNTQLGESNPAEVENKLGSTYRGQHIIGTTEAKKLCLNEDISVMGLKSEFGNIGNGTTFSKGMSLQEILEQILCKEIDVKASAPTASLTNTNTAVEYGTEISDTPVTITLNQGKFVPIESGWTANQYMDCKLASAEVSGNAATIAEDGLTASYTIPGFVCTATTAFTATASVTANTVVPTKNNGKPSTASYAGGTITVTGTRQWTPSYTAFYGLLALDTSGGTPAQKVLNSSIIRGLNTKTGVSLTPSDVTLVGSTVLQDKTNYETIIACPPGYKLKSIKDKMTDSDYTDKFSSEDVDITCGSKTVTYKVYRKSNLTANLNSYINIVIGKA